MLLKKIFLFIIIVMVMVVMEKQCVFAENNEIMDEFDFDDIQKFINEDDELENINFKEIVNDFMSGDAKSGAGELLIHVRKIFFSQIESNFSTLKKILCIAILAAILTNFTKILKNSQVSDTGFIVCYMIIISLIITSFTTLSILAVETLQRMTDFMKALIPVYMISVGVSNGQVYAASSYQMALIVITIIDMVCLKILLPTINIYVIFNIINNLQSEDYLSKACILIENIISFSIKAVISIVMALNVIKQMFMPVNDNMRNSAITNVLGIVSGMGNSTGNIVSLVYGTGSILKNAIGGAGVIVLMMIVLTPIIKIVVFIFSYQFTNAFLQPISDERIISCMEGISKGAVLMLRIVFLACLMFAITIAIICMKN